MRLGALFTTVWLSALSAKAVLIEDAFKKDWIHYNYGVLSSPQLLDDSSLIGLSNSNFLYTIDAESGRVKSYIDLSVHKSDQFKLLDNVIVAYSRESTQVSLFDKASGIFIDSTNLESVPVFLEEVFGGLAILTANHELIYWKGTNKVHLGSYKHKSFTHFSVHQKSFIFIGSQTLEISHDDLSHQLVTPHAWERFVIDKKNPETVRVVNDNYLVQRVGSAIVLAQIGKDGSTEVYKRDFKSISDFQVSAIGVSVATQGNIELIKLSDFYESGSKQSIEVQTLEVQASTPYIVSKNAISTLTIEEGEARLEKFTFHSKNRVSFTIPLKSHSFSGKSILVDKPESLSKLDLAHHLAEETQSASVLLHWILRYKNHLVSLGKFMSSLRHKSFSTSHADGDEYGFGKILLSIDEAEQTLVAFDTIDGSVIWEQKFAITGEFIDLAATKDKVYLVSERTLIEFDLRTGEKVSEESFSTKVEKMFQINSERGTDIDDKSQKIFALRTGDTVKVIPKEARLHGPQHFIELTEKEATSYKLIDEKLVKTWALDLSNEKILEVTKNKDFLSVATGIARSDRSVLYKYLNPNVVSIISYTDDRLIIRIIDGITGAVIHRQDHRNEKFDPKSVKLEQNDNWVVYTYLSTFPKIEQRIVVIDIFQNEQPKAEELSFDTRNVSISTKAFIFPEKIEALGSTVTKFGITIKSLFALTSTGSLVEVPKYVLNSRRIDDRKMTPADAMDDFRLSPYEPVVVKNLNSVLNHKNKIIVNEKKQNILVLPTELESSSVVCVVNDLNAFCTISQPSSSYDLLSTSFDKTKLIFTIVILLGAYIGMKPFVHSKKLNAQWIV